MKHSVEKESLLRVVAPSILAADPLRLAEEIESLGDPSPILHVDIMDSYYVPNMHGGPDLVKALARHSDKILDVHLMVEKPERVIDSYIAAGADILTIHQEATRHPLRWLSYIRQAGILAGISLNPGTNLNVLEDLLQEADLLLLMTVNPGFGGQKFIPGSLSRIERCRRLLDQEDHQILLEADGGLDPENAASVWAAGINIMVAGSSVFGASDRAARIKLLTEAPDSARE